MKVSSSIAKAKTTNLPVTTNAIEMKAAFGIVLLILLTTQVGYIGRGADPE